MIARGVIRRALLLMLLPLPCVAADLSDALRVPPLKPEQRVLDSIQMWNGEIIIDAVDGKTRYNRVALKSGQLTPVTCPLGFVFELAESSAAAFALCKAAPGFRLYRVHGTTWNEEPLPKTFATRKWARLCVSPSSVFVLRKNTVHSRPIHGTVWTKSHYVPPEKQFREGFPFAQHLAATDSALYLGWNWGEWGGGLQKIVVEGSGHGIRLKTGGVPTDEPVQGIVAANDGTVWIATGLAHMSGLWSGLLHDDGARVSNVISQSNMGKSSGMSKLPGDTDISGLAMGPNDLPYVSATQLGIFEASEAGLRPVLEANLRIEYQTESRGFKMIVGSQ